MYPKICPFLCSSEGGCHWVIISLGDRAEPTNPRGGPEGARIDFYILVSMRTLFE